MTTAQEVSRPAFPLVDGPTVSYGRPFPELCRKYVDEVYKVSRVYVIVSRTLANKTPALKQLQDALGEKIVGTRVGMTPHTLFSECLEVVKDCRKLDADFVITLGGSSLTDAAKLVCFAMGNDVEDVDDFMKLPYNRIDDVGHVNPPKIPFISVPTSLSGSEYSLYSGATRDSDHCKFQFSRPCKGPRVIILDPKLALYTPVDFWTSSGVRAIDHCTESYSGFKRIKEVDEACIEGLKRLVPGLLNTKADPSDVKARFDCMIGANYAMTPLKYLVLPGASHGIGHNLGPLGVDHGETSCILLPTVSKYNAKRGANIEEQKKIASVYWTIPEAKALFEAKGLKQKSADLGDLLDVIFRALGMPRSLTEVGIGRDKFDEIAKNSLIDVLVQANPAPLDESNIKEILEMCL